MATLECGCLRARSTEVLAHLADAFLHLLYAGPGTPRRTADACREREEVGARGTHAAGNDARAQRQHLDLARDRVQDGHTTIDRRHGLAQQVQRRNVRPMGIPEYRHLRGGCGQTAAGFVQRAGGQFCEVGGKPPGEPVQDINRALQALARGEKTLFGQGSRRTEY